MPPATSRPDQHEDDRDARQRPPGRLGRDLEGDLDLAGQRRLQLADPRVDARAVARRPCAGPAAGSATGGCRRARSASATTSAASRYRSKRSWAAVRSAVSRSAWRAFSSIDRRSARAVSASTRRSRALASASRSRSSCASAVSPCSSDAVAWPSDGVSATLSRPGFLSPFVVSSKMRALELALGPARAPVGAADGGLQAVAEGRLVACEIGQLVVADGRGRAEERLGRDAGQLGDDLVGERRVGDRLPVVAQVDRALRAAERLLERAGLARRRPRPARTRC